MNSIAKQLKMISSFDCWLTLSRIYLQALVTSFILIKCFSSTSPYNVYNYDLTTPVFTPDGLIKQVEYASDAASQSSPILFCPFLIPSIRSSSSTGTDIASTETHHEARDVVELGLIVASMSRCKQGMNANKEDFSSQSHLLSRSRGQRRIIDLPISMPYSNLSDKHIILGLSGLLPDSMELVSFARDYLMQSLHSSYGIHNLHHSSHSFADGVISQPPMATAGSSAFRLAQFLASKCQERAFGGGLRAFGSTIVLCGVDFSPSITKDDSTVSGIRICVVDPSGKLSSMSYSSESYKIHEDEPPDLLFIVGGTDETERDRLRHHVRRYISSKLCESSNFIRLHLEATLSALVSLNLNSDPYAPVGRYIPHENVGHSYDIELILVTEQGGIQRLSEDQVLTLLRSMNSTGTA